MLALEKPKLFYVTHYFLPAILTAIVVMVGIYDVYTFRANDWDYGLYSNVFWNIANGNGWYISLGRGFSASFFLADHMALLMALFAPIFKVFPSMYTFSVLQSLSCGLALFLIPVLTKEIWQDSLNKNSSKYAYLPYAFVLIFCLIFSKALSGVIDYQGHQTSLAMPLVLCAIIALHRKALSWALLWSIMLACAQERASVAVFGIGMYAILLTNNLRFGLALCASSTIYFFTMVKLVIPYLNTQYGYIFRGNISPFEDLYDKARFLLRFAFYSYFLPFFGLRAFKAALCAMPVLGIGLVSNRPSMYQFYHHYQDLPLMFLIVASAHGLYYISNHKLFCNFSERTKKILALGLIVFAFSTSAKNPINLLFKMNFPEHIISLNNEIDKYKDIDKEIRVYSTSGIGSHLSMRKHKHHLSRDTANHDFTNSILFVAPGINSHPEKEPDKLLKMLDENSSLVKISDKNGLVVYKDKNLDLNLD